MIETPMIKPVRFVMAESEQIHRNRTNPLMAA